MPTCFVIQPFDGDRFDKRFEQVFTPAINAAGLTPYRVDKDFTANVPIDSIESGIKSASVCLADITTDNPNVWYELGYAFATGTPVAMVCAAVREGKKYPFDIQHRTVMSYTADAPGDFVSLQERITKRLQALLEKESNIRRLAESSDVAPVAGLSQPELTILAALAGSLIDPDDAAGTLSVKQDSERAGLTNLGFSLGLRKLIGKSFVRQRQIEQWNEEPYPGLVLTDEGWTWIEQNEDKFLLKTSPSERVVDDHPF